MIKNFISYIAAISFLFLVSYGCVTAPLKANDSKHSVVIEIITNGSGKTLIPEISTKPKINYSMVLESQEGTLSRMSFILKGKEDEGEAYIKLFSSLTVGDVSNLWNDISVLEKATTIRKINLFINSPGGDAFSGLALADQLERAKRKGFYITAHASGIVASAAVPVFVVANMRLAAPGTIFMVHETSIWKWPGRETASDIRSQNKLMMLIRDRYLGKLAYYSKLSVDEWGDLEQKTTWFSAEQAKEWGIVDEIE